MTISKQARFVTDAQFIAIGRRHGCDDVALEASEASARWARDEAALAAYGFGPNARVAFEADRSKHDALRAARPEAVASKKMSVSMRDKQVSDGWAWVDRVTSTLGLPARNDEALSTALATATPMDDAGLETGIQALAKVLAANKGTLPADAQADKRLGEVDSLCAALQASPGTLQTSKGQTVADTAQIDLYDGKLCLWIRDLNRAGRQAIRNGDLHRSLQEYALHHLKHSGNPAPHPASASVPPASPNPAAGTH
jgi:phosphopantetheinyl transferase (holo-ACP synthase)